MEILFDLLDCWADLDELWTECSESQTSQFLVLRAHCVQVEPVGRLHLEECCVDVCMAIHNKPSETCENSEAIIIHAISREGNILRMSIKTLIKLPSAYLGTRHLRWYLRMKMAPRGTSHLYTLMFWKVCNSMKLIAILCYASGSQKSKMEVDIRGWPSNQGPGHWWYGCLHAALAVFVLAVVHRYTSLSKSLNQSYTLCRMTGWLYFSELA